MISTSFLNFNDEFFFFTENFTVKQNYFNFENYSFFFAFSSYLDLNFVFLNNNSKLHAQSLITFINQTEDLNFFNNLENLKTIYHYSIPNTKLSYPEPFIASASFMHNDIWFVHILVYQYWLWFVFVFLVVFFFTMFVVILRWCNMRIRPRRETRGVSRSKCADLITACVPVSWATSIIVSESTDAVDYYDGFGTTELVVGIRAYQWGWEYYYPKDIDLHYNIKHNYSSFVGNSLKYNTSTDLNLRANNLWKFYQNKSLDSVVTPAHLLLLPVDNFKLLNFINLNDAGANPLNESAAFKKVRMFSKTFSTNLVFLPNYFNSKYKQFSNLFITDNLFENSLSYGFKKQHNFLTNYALSNNSSTFFNLKSSSKWLNFNLKHNTELFKTFTGQNSFNFLTKTSLLNLQFSNMQLFNILNKNLYSDIHNILFKTTVYPSVLNLFNNDSDKKKLKYSIFKLFTEVNNKYNFIGLSNVTNLELKNDLTNGFFNKLLNEFTNNNLSYKNHTSFSPNQAVFLENKTLRRFADIAPTSTPYNFSFSLNAVSGYLDNINSNLFTNGFFFYNLAAANWIDLTTFSKLSNNRVHPDFSFSPINSNQPIYNFLDFDDYKNTYMEGAPILLQGKEDLMPASISSIYWNFYWGNTNIDWRINNNLTYRNIHNNFYLPIFNFYYDYDFRNWQTLELLEDAYWESLYSIYTFDEYLNLSENFYKEDYVDKNANFFYKFDKEYKFKNNVISKAPFKILNINGDFYANSFYTDDFITPSKLMSTDNFFIFSLFSSLDSLDDSYESLKFLNYFYNTSHKILLLSATNTFYPYSYSLVFDMFRSDYDEFSWFTDENYNVFKNNFVGASLFEQFLKLASTAAMPNLLLLTDLFTFNLDLNTSEVKNLRFSNYLNLRSSIKNSIVTYNAIQKVFKARFDEGRSNAKLLDFGNFYDKHPYVTTPRIHYEKLLGKNKESFFKINLYKSNFFNFFNKLYATSASLNFYTFDFPFLLAMKSDASRYLWFDWYAKWGVYEVQPSSASRYALYGMPYFSKNFEFSTQIGELLNETETYLLRLSRARKNYLPNWTYTSYLYAKNTNWYQNNVLFEIFNFNLTDVSGTYIILDLMSWYWKNIFFLNFNSFFFTPSNSNINTYTRGSWKPQSSIQSYFYSISTLIDILTKREYLYRQLFEINNKLINLPTYLTSNPKNPLIDELKAAFIFVDPTIYNNEYSRDIYYNSLAFFNFNVLKSIIKSTSNVVNFNFLTDYIFFYFFNFNTNTNLGNNVELYKNQYRPLRKGISNMIRLHATGAIAMPTEIRLQILASSKDVIHSWAIPSAGIKIDCIPGYSSHKVAIFLLSGIFWGQCMEICGRYHHWMPIIIYFMKRDLFFLWCTHFVFLSGSNNIWNINDRQYVDYAKIVSFDKNSWLNEFNL